MTQYECCIIRKLQERLAVCQEALAECEEGGGVDPDPFATLILSRSPLVWYRNNALDGNEALDSSGNGHHGLYQATPDVVLGGVGDVINPHVPVAGILYNQPGPGSDPVIEITSTTAGMRCLGVTIPASATAFTLEQWFYPTNVAGNVNQTMGVGMAFNHAGLYAPFTNQQTYFRDGADVADPAVGINSTGLLSPNNTWRHTVGVVDGNVMKLYVDGALVASSSIHVRAGFDETILAMGYNYEYRPAAHTLGRYGDCMVYLSALTEAQIIENRNARLSS